MQVNKTNNIVFLKNVESNIIDEAIVILKDNIQIHKLTEQNAKFEKYKVKKLEKKNRILKIINALLLIGTLAVLIIK